MSLVKLTIWIAVGICVAALSQAADDYGAASSGSAPRYTFSWPLDGDAVKPRGGTTKGAPITLDRKYWEWSDVRGRPANDAVIDRYSRPGINARVSATYRF